ncbi:MAG: hypothetical protein ACF8GE_08925 [Phycisphaerales bacterium JB043]
MRSILTVATVGAIGMSANAAVQSVYSFDQYGLGVGNMKNLSHTNTWAGAFTSAGDGFETYQRGVNATIPFAVLDDSAIPLSIGGFPGDTIGIEAGWNGFFGVVDTENGDNSGPVSATWAFDITGLTAMSMDIDFAAMGDFEASDVYSIEYDIDGGGFSSLFTITIDEASDETYTMADGDVFLINDPVLVDGIKLNNVFQTLSAGIAGTGSTLTLRLTATANGGTEAFAIDNIVLNGIPTPGAVALLGLGGLVASRRRRA